MRAGALGCVVAGAAGILALAAETGEAQGSATPARDQMAGHARSATVVPDEAHVVREHRPGGGTSILRVGETELFDPGERSYVPLATTEAAGTDEMETARRKRCYRRKIENVERSLGIRQWTLTLRQRWCGRGRRIVAKRKRCSGDPGFNWRVKRTSSVTRLTRSRRGGRTKCRGWFHLDYTPIYQEEERGSIVFDFTGRGATRVVRLGSR